MTLCRRVPGLDALIIDPAGSFTTIDVNKSEQFGGFVMTLRALAARLRIALLLLHHVSKGAVNASGRTGDGLDHHATLGSVMSTNGARVAAVVQRMNKTQASEWGIAESEAHHYVGLLAPKTNGIASMREAAWYQNVEGVPVPVALVHRDKAANKQDEAATKTRARDLKLGTELLAWIEREYQPDNPPSTSHLRGLLISRAGCSKDATDGYLHSLLSSGVLILDQTVKTSNASKGGIRPGELAPLIAIVRPMTDAEALFAQRGRV